MKIKLKDALRVIAVAASVTVLVSFPYAIGEVMPHAWWHYLDTHAALRILLIAVGVYCVVRALLQKSS